MSGPGDQSDVWAAMARMNLARNPGPSVDDPDYVPMSMADLTVHVRPDAYELYAAAAGESTTPATGGMSQPGLFDAPEPVPAPDRGAERLAAARAEMSPWAQKDCVAMPRLSSAAHGVQLSLYALTKYYVALPAPYGDWPPPEPVDVPVDLIVPEYLVGVLTRIGVDWENAVGRPVGLGTVCRFAAVAGVHTVAVRRWVGVDSWAAIMDGCEGNPPPLLDPYAGGGSIPLEYQRLGAL